MEQNFIWCDLSTFDANKAKKFYSKLFGWEFGNDENYFLAHSGFNYFGAIFKMPQKFIKMNMPSFWMSYLMVDDVEKVVEKAKKIKGVIVEIEPTYFDENSKIALIRDPSGAGFTVYEGVDLNGKYDTNDFEYDGSMILNTLHINDLNLVKEFYESVFEFEIVKQKNQSGSYDILNENKNKIAIIEVFLDEIKGKFQYWMPIFGVKNLKNSEKIIFDLDGEKSWEVDEKKIIFSDNQGGSFILQQVD